MLSGLVAGTGGNFFCKTEAQKKAAVRDAALLLIGYAGAFRRSEISSLRIEDVEFVEDGARILLRRTFVYRL